MRLVRRSLAVLVMLAVAAVVAGWAGDFFRTPEDEFYSTFGCHAPPANASSSSKSSAQRCVHQKMERLALLAENARLAQETYLQESRVREFTAEYARASPERRQAMFAELNEKINELGKFVAATEQAKKQFDRARTLAHQRGLAAHDRQHYLDNPQL